MSSLLNNAPAPPVPVPVPVSVNAFLEAVATDKPPVRVRRTRDYDFTSRWTDKGLPPRKRVREKVQAEARKERHRHFHAAYQPSPAHEYEQFCQSDESQPWGGYTGLPLRDIPTVRPGWIRRPFIANTQDSAFPKSRSTPASAPRSKVVQPLKTHESVSSSSSPIESSDEPVVKSTKARPKASLLMQGNRLDTSYGASKPQLRSKPRQVPKRAPVLAHRLPMAARQAVPSRFVRPPQSSTQEEGVTVDDLTKEALGYLRGLLPSSSYAGGVDRGEKSAQLRRFGQPSAATPSREVGTRASERVLWPDTSSEQDARV